MTVRITKGVNRQTRQEYISNLFGAGLRAGSAGGLAVSLLLIVYPFSVNWVRTILMPPALIILWVVTGLAAAMLTGGRVRTQREGRKVGTIAGLVSGTLAGIVAMILAALDLIFSDLKAGIVEQFSFEQLNTLAASGFEEALVATIGTIIMALFTCGFGGMFGASIFGLLGGWLYVRLGRT